MKDKKYTVGELAELSGVTVRTLHHYDEIGLLKPGQRSENGYRYYGRKELLRLQQIMFYRELEMPLEKIAELLDDPEFDAIASLRMQREELGKRSKQISVLIQTIDKTIHELQKNKNMLTDKELYEGFEPAQGEAYRKEAIDRWGEKSVLDSENKIRSMTKEEFGKIQNTGHTTLQKLASQMSLGADHPDVLQTVKSYHDYINAFADTDKERFGMLGEMYAEDERFAKHYENYAPGLSVFLRDAIRSYVKS